MSNKYETIVGKNGVEYTTLRKDYFKEITEKKYKRLLKKSGIDPNYWNIGFEDYQGSISASEVERIKNYANKCHLPEMDYVHLYLWGENNCQKTALACNVGKAAICHGMKVKKLLGNELISLLMKLQGFNFEKEIYHQYQDLLSQDLLIIDDCFDDKKSLMWKSENRDIIIAEWDTFFRKVLASSTRVVTTSNFPIENLSEKYGVSFFELLNRYMVKIQLLDSIKAERISYVEGKI